MGILPLVFLPGPKCRKPGLTGFETFDIVGISESANSESANSESANSESANGREAWRMAPKQMCTVRGAEWTRRAM